jgi:hypothetical protein
MRVRGRVRALAACGALSWATTVAAQQWAIDDPGQGPLSLPAGADAARELSGLSWAGGGRWAAVSDDDGRLFWLRVTIDPASGRITGAAVDGHLELAGSRDLEGVAIGAEAASVYVSDEVGPAIRQYRLPDGRLMGTAMLPSVLTGLRPNLGLEALTRDARGSLWTANEEALTADGQTSTAEAGTLVRLVRFDADLRPTGQWAYRTDPIAGATVLGDRGTGLSDLAALPDGSLLALERSLGSEGLRIRLYELDLAGAADVSQRPSLADADVVAVGKTLLWEHTSLTENFEGAALGPPLADAGYSLLLVSDNGHKLAQALYPLRLRRR